MQHHNDTNHTANFLVSLFLKSKFSLKYVDSASQCSILRYIADAIDHYFKQTNKKSMCFSRKQIAIYSRTSESTVKRVLQHFIKKRILKISYQSGWHSVYEIGILPLAYAQKILKLSPGRVISKKSRGHSEPTSNIDSNSKDNNKGILKSKEKLKAKIVQQNGRIALRKMGERLGLKTNH